MLVPTFINNSFKDESDDETESYNNVDRRRHDDNEHIDGPIKRVSFSDDVRGNNIPNDNTRTENKFNITFNPPASSDQLKAAIFGKPELSTEEYHSYYFW